MSESTGERVRRKFLHPGTGLTLFKLLLAMSCKMFRRLPEEPPEITTTLETMKAPDVGVLLVHGMGEQARGDTLLGFGEPLYRWIDGWINQTAYPNALQSDVRLNDTTLLRPRLSDPDAPPYMRLEATWTVNGARQTKTFLIAESWWAKEFTGVSFSQMLSWATAFAPWMFERYARRRWSLLGQARAQSGWRQSRLLGQWLGIYVLAILASFLFQVVILGLVLLAVIPKMRGVAAALQIKIAGAFGDPYILATSPVRFDAMVSQVQRDLDWLCKRECPRLAVVAHSQGSVVAREAMREKYYPAVRRFITFGNPFGKLHLAREGLPAWDRLFWKALWRNLGTSRHCSEWYGCSLRLILARPVSSVSCETGCNGWTACSPARRMAPRIFSW
ncbi:MAG: hypothetical protein H0T49_00950 [Chloroflexia bacterium]|nr:hypothetical protein [Chloroflexia bacterium]